MAAGGEGESPGEGGGRRWRVPSPSEQSSGELLAGLGMWRTIEWGDGGRNTRHTGESGDQEL